MYENAPCVFGRQCGKLVLIAYSHPAGVLVVLLLVSYTNYIIPVKFETCEVKLNKFFIFIGIINAFLAGVVVLFGGTPKEFIPTVIFPLGLVVVSYVALLFESNSLLVNAWDKGYLKAIEDTQEAVVNKRSADIDFRDSNPYRGTEK